LVKAVDRSFSPTAARVGDVLPKIEPRPVLVLGWK
jgi:hypothetical protein